VCSQLPACGVDIAFVSVWKLHLSKPTFPIPFSLNSRYWDPAQAFPTIVGCYVPS